MCSSPLKFRKRTQQGGVLYKWAMFYFPSEYLRESISFHLLQHFFFFFFFFFFKGYSLLVFNGTHNYWTYCHSFRGQLSKWRSLETLGTLFVLLMHVRSPFPCQVQNWPLQRYG